MVATEIDRKIGHQDPSPDGGLREHRGRHGAADRLQRSAAGRGHQAGPALTLCVLCALCGKADRNSNQSLQSDAQSLWWRIPVPSDFPNGVLVQHNRLEREDALRRRVNRHLDPAIFSRAEDLNACEASGHASVIVVIDNAIVK